MGAFLSGILSSVAENGMVKGESKIGCKDDPSVQIIFLLLFYLRDMFTANRGLVRFWYTSYFSLAGVAFWI